MSKTITIELSERGIDKAIKEVREYKQWVEEKEKELRLRLAQRGAVVASIKFARAIRPDEDYISVRVDDTGSVAVIYAEGEAVAFVEFGAGAKYGYGHPKPMGFGPGTYPSDKGNWDNPNGWWYGSGQHTYGNPPAMAMYEAVQIMAEEYTQIAREVFSK